jgi:hypothetical protein
MREELSRIRGCLVVAAAVAAFLLAAGCGGGSGNTGSTTVGEITVQTGSLSKDEFVAKANEICRTARKEFNSEYEKFLNSPQGKQGSQSALIKEVVELFFLPHFEKEIEQISELGAPQDYAAEAASYMNALKKQLDQAKENPPGVLTSGVFQKPIAVARKAGLNGCAESLS